MIEREVRGSRHRLNLLHQQQDEHKAKVSVQALTVHALLARIKGTGPLETCSVQEGRLFFLTDKRGKNIYGIKIEKRKIELTIENALLIL